MNKTGLADPRVSAQPASVSNLDIEAKYARHRSTAIASRNKCVLIDMAIEEPGVALTISSGGVKDWVSHVRC